MQRVRSQFVNAADDDDNRPLELKSTLISAIKSECLSDRDAGFCSGGDDTDLDTELFRSPSSNSRDSSCIDTKQTDDHNRGRRRSDDSIFSRISSRSSSSGHSSCSSISNNNNNTTATTSTTTKRKSVQPLRLLTDGQLAVKRRIVNVEKSPVEVRLIKTEPILSDDIVAADNDSKRTVVSPFRPWSNSSAGRTNGSSSSSSKPVVSRTDDDHRMLIDHYHPVEVPSGYLPVPYLHRNHLRSSTAYNNDDTTNSNAADDDNINNVQSEPLSLVVVKKNKDMEIPTFKQEDSGTSRSSLTGDSFTFTNPSFNINSSSSNSRPLKVDRKAIAKDMVVVVKEEITDDDNNFYHPGCDREDDETVVVDNIQKKEQTVEESSQKQPTDNLGDDTDIAHRRLNNQQQQRNYKNMTRERRIEANARERTRVHTISAAFDNLRQSVPSYANDQKLSKLSVLRIACAYISTLSRLAGHDYTADQSVPSVADCVDNVCNTIQLEGKTRKKKDD